MGKEISIRVLTPFEQKYTYVQSGQIEGQTGCRGHMRGSLEGVNDRFCTMKSGSGEKTDAFSCEVQKVFQALCEEGGPLHSRFEMEDFVRAHPDSVFMGEDCPEYGFRVDYGEYAFLFRCNLSKAGGDFYASCYVRDRLDRHIQRAEQGIRFIDSNYRELFRIPDGGRIMITTAEEDKEECICRFIDETHMEMGDRWKNLYHICQFAEQMERNGAVCEPKAGEETIPRITKHNKRESSRRMGYERRSEGR